VHTRYLALLLKLKLYFGVGKIRTDEDGTSVYSLGSLKYIIGILIPHFTKFPLIIQKQAYFLLFKMIVEMNNRKEHLTKEGLRKIVSIKASLN
jgi:hypothetical protein